MITLPHGAGEREAPDIDSMTRPPLAPLGWFCRRRGIGGKMEERRTE